MHRSVATIDSPQFINLQPLDINPLMSKCQIKVFYVGANRNRTFITEDVAIEIGKRLRGAPIVGYYRKDKEDFTTHGEKVIIDDEGIRFECETVPYGFVSPNAKVWFQNFEDYDEAGDPVIHKYLMTTGYLWTEQFPESSLPVEEGRPQSMEFHKNKFTGHWGKNEDGLDFFIIHDAVIQKICILGDEVEPCFEGASVTAPEVSANFKLDDNFKHTLYSMMQDLKSALEGGQQMENFENPAVVEEIQPESNYQLENSTTAAEVLEDTSSSTDYAKKDDEEKENSSKDKEDAKESDSSKQSSSEKEDSKDDDEKDDKEDDDEKKKYELLNNELASLKQSYLELQQQCQELVEFKRNVDNQRKDALIAEFYMLSDEDKADVIQNKEKYTLDEIKSKLSVICFDKKVSFTAANDTTANVEEEKVITYQIKDSENNSLPEWVRAVKEFM